MQIRSHITEPTVLAYFYCAITYVSKSMVNVVIVRAIFSCRLCPLQLPVYLDDSLHFKHK